MYNDDGKKKDSSLFNLECYKNSRTFLYLGSPSLSFQISAKFSGVISNNFEASRCVCVFIENTRDLLFNSLYIIITKRGNETSCTL